MSKKYLSLEEAAGVLRLGTDELIRLREKGSIRGFADRGTWKFREEDVQELLRSRQVDSAPDIPMLSDSAVGMEDEFGEQETIIRQGVDPLSSSDSEVKLMGTMVDDISASDVQPLAGESDIRPISLGSDSDVKLSGKPAPAPAAKRSGVQGIEVENVQGSDIRPLAMGDSKLGMRASDSAKKIASGGKPLMDSDSDVALVPAGGDDSDSDVKLMSESSGEIPIGTLDDQMSSDSDVRLVADTPSSKIPGKGGTVKPGKNQSTSDSDVALLADDDDAIALDFTPADDESASVLADESGIALSGTDSAMLLQGESGISLEGPSDSGIALSANEDEGITLDIGGDSGISLESAADSGISLESVADSGISLEDSNDFGATAPMMLASKEGKGKGKGKKGKGEEETAYEIPSLGADDSEFELAAVGGSDEETAVFDLSDAEDSGEVDDAVFDLDESSDGEGEADEFAEDDLEVADDILGEDDELDELDVFDADEGAFDEGSSAGSQQFAAPVGGGYVEHEWGGGTFASLLISTAMLAVVGIVMLDLVNNIWSFHEPNGASSAILDGLRGLYKK
jgi:excisionase family DNA binding protein